MQEGTLGIWYIPRFNGDGFSPPFFHKQHICRNTLRDYFLSISVVAHEAGQDV